MGFFDRFRRQPLPRTGTPEPGGPPPGAPEPGGPPPGPFPVEAQLAELRDLGIQLAPGVTLDHVLGGEGSREWIEEERFRLLGQLAVDDEESLVATVPGVARIHLEQVEDDDCYPHIVRVLARAARRESDLGVVNGQLDEEAEECRVDYEISGRSFSLEPEVQGDWVDGMAVNEIAEDLAPKGLQCAWWIDDDAWCTWLPPQQAERLTQLIQQRPS